MSSEDPAPPLAVDRECYSGHRGEETPWRFSLAGADIEIAEVVDRWLAPDHRYFKVQDRRGDGECARPVRQRLNGFGRVHEVPTDFLVFHHELQSHLG